MRSARLLTTLAAALALAAPLRAQVTTPLDSATLASFRWRSVGPANMGGRITDIEAVATNPKIFYVAAAAGGIWKTTNAGTSFIPVFDRERVISMGDIAIAPSDPNVIYAGTGEEDSRNSISPGGGVYKSTDAGATWQLVGLERTQHVGRIVVHPTDPNTVYVAALGAAWGANPERGLYKTTDGGRTWQLSKFISDRAGFVDVAMDPSDPNTLYAASWERVRGPWFLRSGGPGSGLWKTTDAGRTWTEIRGGGLPETTKGRIGLAIAPSNPQIVYALVESDSLPNPRRGPAWEPKPGDQTYGLGGAYPASKATSGLFRSSDGGRTWQRMNRENNRPFYYSQIRVDPKNPERIYQLATQFQFSDDGGKTLRRGALGIHVDFHALWINPNDPDHYILGSDGAIAQTYDKGGNYDFISTIALGQFYAVSFDMHKSYRVCGGLQDNGSWCGPSRTRGSPIQNADWFMVGGGDGFYTAQDPEDPDIIYSESQGGNISRYNLATNLRTPIRSGFAIRNRRMAIEDSVIVARGDTARPETPEVTRRVSDIRARFRAESLAVGRFNWQTPFFLSPHNPRTVYAAGNRVIKSMNRGDQFVPISPDLSNADSVKIRISTTSTGGLTPDVTGAETHGTVTTLAESAVRPGILWAGTDDGNVWVTRNDGGAWENLTTRFPGVPRGTWVSRVEPSNFDTATVYVAFDGHRTNDFRPYVYVSTDFGRTFRSITANLPTGGPDFVHVVREDPHNRDLLFVGTDVGAYVSTDRGRSWQRFMTGLPTVPVHDLKIHPRDRELIAGTHGRSIWIVDIAALEQMNDSLLRTDVAFFTPKTAYQYSAVGGFGGGGMGSGGQKVFQAPVPPYGAEVVYRIAGQPAAANGARRDSAARDSAARIVITDVAGDTVRVLRGASTPGIHRVVWNLRKAPPPLGPAGLRDSIANARRVEARRDSIRRARGDTTRTDTTVAAMPMGRDSAMMRTMRDSMQAMRGRGDTAGVRQLQEQMRQRMAAMGERGGRRGPGGGPGGVNLRPAEAPLGAEPQFGGGGGGGGFGGQRQGAHVEPGSYLVTLTANGKTHRQVVKVERVGDVSDGPGFETERER